MPHTHVNSCVWFSSSSASTPWGVGWGWEEEPKDSQNIFLKREMDRRIGIGSDLTIMSYVRYGKRDLHGSWHECCCLMIVNHEKKGGGDFCSQVNYWRDKRRWRKRKERTTARSKEERRLFDGQTTRDRQMMERNERRIKEELKSKIKSNVCSKSVCLVDSGLFRMMRRRRMMMLMFPIAVFPAYAQV